MIELATAQRQIGQTHLTYSVANGSLSSSTHSLGKIRNLEAGFFRVKYSPKQNRINIDAHQIARKRLLGIERRRDDSLIYNAWQPNQ